MGEEHREALRLGVGEEILTQGDPAPVTLCFHASDMEVLVSITVALDSGWRGSIGEPLAVDSFQGKKACFDGIWWRALRRVHGSQPIMS